MDFTLTVLDTAGIQRYIFGSNELRENIGASELSLRATTLLAFDHLDKLEEPHNIDIGKSDSHDWDYRETGTSDMLESEVKAAEVIYAGGGNTVILFGGANHLERARRFVYSLSYDLMKTAPGLTLYAAHEHYDKTDKASSLPKCVKQAIRQLAQLKGELPPPSPLLGLGVTAACTSTGLPAVGAHPSEDKQPLASLASAEVKAKWRYSEERFAKERLRGYFKDESSIAPFLWSDDLDLIGRVPGREESFIAVVHADGNGMGRRIMQLNDLFAEEFPEQPRAYITAMRALSKDLQRTARKALTATVVALRKKLIEKEAEDPLHPTRWNNKKKVEEAFFPFRPIVFGGDDVTWVCAGIWGISLARRYLLELEKRELPDFVKLLTDAGIDEAEAARVVAERRTDNKLPVSNIPYACAGVSIVKTHYPFSQAYNMSEQLAKSAKDRVLEVEKSKAASAIDWHFTTTGLTGSLKEIRKREYQVAKHNLTARPLLLDSKWPTWRNWKNFYDIWQQFDLGWFDSRNKVVALREAVRGGPEAVRQFALVERRGSRLPVLDLGPGGFSLENGWVESKTPPADQKNRKEIVRCAYFDAIEVADMLEEIGEEKA